VFRLGDEHDDIFGGKFEALTIWNAFSGDGVAWPARIDAANSEAFTAGIKFAPKSAWREPVPLGEQLEHVFLDIDASTIGSGELTRNTGSNEKPISTLCHPAASMTRP
jgi:hypothetical protein